MGLSSLLQANLYCQEIGTYIVLISTGIDIATLKLIGAVIVFPRM
jgi:hypothetical protein